MPVSLTTFSDLSRYGFDTVIDVRSPAEFAEDHLPGALNLPVLSNEERALVGTVYKQQSPFKGRKLGAALVFRNAADHLAGPLADRPGGWRPLVYCWRGGQRSGAFAWMLREIGWPAETVKGGYKSFRRLVVQQLYETPLPHRLIRLGGYTGTAKTEILNILPDFGVQILDLEDLACHRGSLLGARETPQPSQKGFETAVMQALHALDPEQPVVVEAESSKIGRLSLPPSLWDAMRAAPWVEVSAPLAARATYLAEAYRDILEDTERLIDRLTPLRAFRGHGVVSQWAELARSGDRLSLCGALAQDHYDPSYDKSKPVATGAEDLVLHVEKLGRAELRDVARRLADWVHASSI